MSTVKYTPMMQQYIKIKEDYADAIVFFRLGDFYEMFFDDAIVASKVLEIALTSRDGGQKVPMCGVPHHAAKAYIQKLVAKGFKVAIAEQVTEPGKGLVEREVTKLITPGMIIEEGMLDDHEFNFIASISLSENGYLLFYADISTGETYYVEGIHKDVLFDEIRTLKLKEVVLASKVDKSLVAFLEENDISISIQETNELLHHRLIKNLPQKYLKSGASILIAYLMASQKQEFNHLMPFEKRQITDYMHLDYRVNEHLEITQTQSNHQRSTLIYWLDKTHTAMGSRLLKYWLTHPLKDKIIIENRLDLVEAFMAFEPRGQLNETLDYIYDINRIVTRISMGNANARDLYHLKETLLHIPALKEILKQYKHPKIDALNEKIDPHETLCQLLEKAVREDAPLTIKEGGMIKFGYDEKLDELMDVSHHGKDWLKQFENQEKERTGIRNLKVGYNRIFGYYIEISKGNLGLVRDEFGYTRKQTLASSERFITESLKEKETMLLTAKDKAIALEYDIFVTLREKASQYTTSLQHLSATIASVDAYASLALVAEENRYVRPKFSNHGEVEVVLGRHPVVEKHTEFVANHVTMKPKEVFVITGPNMSGKSTYMRMFALIVIMAQSGSFIPANQAKLPIYDAIFTRIGSSDDISSGKSTFMVEMVEANEALMKATPASLILFDEIGRGTATYDGLALAQGMIEYIHDEIGCQMFFSTHYHELTQLSNKLSHVTNLHVKAKEEKDRMVFLHQVQPGASDRSYGIQVASLANLPEKVISRSKSILKKLEKQSEQKQDNLFTIQEEETLKYVIPKETQGLLDELMAVDIDRLTPVDALIRLKYLQSLLKK